MCRLSAWIPMPVELCESVLWRIVRAPEVKIAAPAPMFPSQSLDVLP